MEKLTEYRVNKDDRPYNGRINLYLTGFKKQDIITVDEIVTAVDRMPDVHLQGLKELVYDPERKTLEDVDYSQWFALANSKGSFLRQERYIFIYEFECKAQFHQILYHEMGHYVYYLIIGSVLKKKWVTETSPSSKHVTNYASRNASEDFAESYAAYLLRPNDLIGIPKKYLFMQREVFKGFVPQPLKF